MKLREIIERLDRTKANGTSVPSQELLEELRVSTNDYIDLEEHGFSAYNLANWYCTDTWVGGTVIFYQDKPIVQTWQSARKSDTEFFWIGGKETYDSIFAICRELISPDACKDVQCCDLDVEYGRGIKVAYSGQLLNERVILDETGELVAVVKKFDDYKDIKQWQTVVICAVGGKKRTVHMREITVPFNISSGEGDIDV